MNESAAAVLIYDGECAYCSVTVSVLKRLDNVEAISWYDDTAQTFLDAQFADVPFAMALVDHREDRVYVGRVTTKELTDRAEIPGLLGSLTRGSCDRIARVIGVASGCGRGPDDVHSVYDLEPDAADLFVPLFDNVEPQPVELS